MLNGIPLQVDTSQVLSYEAKDLKPFKNYTFKVRARGSAGFGKEAAVKGQTLHSSKCYFQFQLQSHYSMQF